MKTIVATTVNPFSKLAYQKLCFEKWKELGVEVKSFNTEQECEILRQNGFGDNDLIEIEKKESGINLFKKEIPRIQPIINRLNELKYDYYFLTNSDIYPSSNKNPSRGFSTFGDVLCFTRNECVDVLFHQYIDSNPYRGGLDVFFFSRKGLKDIVNVLLEKEVANRMTFGVPGWDYYLAHHILKKNPTGIMDSEIFLHQSHKTSYGNINEFSFYADEMAASGYYRSKNANGLAEEFSEKINLIADANSDKSNAIKKIYYCPSRALNKNLETKDDSFLLDKIESNLIKLGCSVKSRSHLFSFLRRQYEGLNWTDCVYYIQSDLKIGSKRYKYLVAIFVMLLLQKHFGQARYIESYPKGNMHGAALRQIIENTTGVERLEYIVSLFGSELIEHSLFNRYLFNFIVLSMNSRKDLKVCSEIKKYIFEGGISC